MTSLVTTTSRRRAGSFNFGKFLLSLLFDAPWIVTQIGLIRLFIELVINSGKKN